MWEKDFEGTVSLSAANKKLIILTERGVLVIADASPTGYNELSSARVLDEKATGRFWTPPVLCRGRIYCRSQSGELACIDMRE
jgi:outer membrane protein assembly factor BamB